LTDAGAGVLINSRYVDLDGFKETNDVFGHNAGDAVLKETAARMTHCVRHGDTVARLGGDEFVVLLPQLGKPADAERIASKIDTALDRPFFFNQQELRVGGSLGISIWPRDGDQPERVLKFADEQMYREKTRRTPSGFPSLLKSPAAKAPVPNGISK
jgi:diguanylate cyclase (GGDEF)-like protein